jgi:AmmeMemoRadiSam system protein B
MRLATAFDGSFYPAEPEALAEVVDHFLDHAPKKVSGKILGAVVPHAGYVYSGMTAGMAFGTFRGLKPDAVVLMGPSHRVRVRGVRIFEAEGFESPLGVLPASRQVLDELVQTLGPGAKGSAFCEHSVEVQLPFLARALPQVPVIELVFGPAEEREVERVVSALLLLRRAHEILVVASSDLSHYYDHQRAQVLDGRFRDLLLKSERAPLAEALRRGETEACGAGAVLSLLAYTEALGGRFEAIHQCDSSLTSGDESQVVGYLSALAILPGETG